VLGGGARRAGAGPSRPAGSGSGSPFIGLLLAGGHRAAQCGVRCALQAAQRMQHGARTLDAWSACSMHAERCMLHALCCMLHISVPLQRGMLRIATRLRRCLVANLNCAADPRRRPVRAPRLRLRRPRPPPARRSHTHRPPHPPRARRRRAFDRRFLPRRHRCRAAGRSRARGGGGGRGGCGLGGGARSTVDRSAHAQLRRRTADRQGGGGAGGRRGWRAATARGAAGEGALAPL